MHASTPQGNSHEIKQIKQAELTWFGEPAPYSTELLPSLNTRAKDLIFPGFENSTGMEDVKLIGAFPSPFSYRVEWALKLKGIAYEYIKEDLKNKSPLLLESNPVYKKVPVLLHNGKPIVESPIILEYIEETWKENALLPEDPYERATARFWANFAEDKLILRTRTALLSQGKEKDAAAESLSEELKILDAQLQGKKFFGGERVGFLDLVLGWIPHWLPVFEEVADMKVLNADQFPRLAEWGENFLKVPAIKDNLPPQDKMVVYFHVLRKSRLSSNPSK